MDFDLAILGIRVTGTLSRTVDASLTNTGNAEATSVWVKVEVFSGGARVRVNGKDYERVDIGSLGAGASVQRSVTLSFGFWDGLRLQSQGALVVATVLSDQATKTLEVSYKP